MSNEDLLDVASAARRLGLRRSTIYALTHRKAIKFVKLGRSVRFRPADLDAYVEAHVVEPEEVRIDV